MRSSPPARALEGPADRMHLGGRYRLLEHLGAGGMGAVYRAHDETLDRIVAIKQLKLRPDARNASAMQALFEREYHTLARLQHPRIIAVYDYGVVPEGPYYSMELLDGKDLQQLSPLGHRDACRYLRDVASSLALLHAHRLIHRDVSPRNVKLTSDGRAKLIDFGALTTFGIASEVIGTPMRIAPEAVQRMPLDQRTDLYALGAVAYLLLTGRPPFAVRALQELSSAWEQAPAPPSSIVPGIPAALDSLVLSLLNPDPMERPSTAAAVIDRLTVIGGLPVDDDHEQAGESYLSSGRLVGRETERAWVSERVGRVFEGQGSELVVEGPPGIGRTRLLRELCLDAQLRAIVSLRVDAEAVPTAYGVPISLALQLLTVAPEIARQAAAASAPLLAQLSPDLRDKLEVPQLAPLAEDPNERRAQFSTALHDWFMQVVATMPLLVAVDNVQAADDASAAFLAGLGQESRRKRLVVLVTQRTGDPIAAPAPVRLLRRRSGHLKLGGIDGNACEALAKSLFGDVSNVVRVAKILHERSAGNPQQYMDLARLLVRKKIARYTGGAWALPFEVSEDELPSRASEIREARLAVLSAPARSVAEALSIHANPVALEYCSKVVADLSEGVTYSALDELVAEQILVAERGQYRFEHSALREAIFAQLSDDRRRALHVRASAALLASGDSIAIRMEAAWHVMRAGDELAGAAMLAAAAQEFLRNAGAQQSIEHDVRALETALDVFERHGRSEYELAGLMFALIPLAFFIDRRVMLRYAERAVELGLKITGLGRAQRVSRFTGKKLGLVIGLVTAGVQFKKQRKLGLNYDLRAAISSFCGIVPASVGTFNICYDITAVERLTTALEPLRLFGPDHIATLMHDFARAQLAMGQSREWDAREILERLDTQFNRPQIIEVLGEAHWRAMYGGILYSLGILHPYEFGSRALERARAMEALGVRVWAMAADQVRMLYHALRGESERVNHYRERVELYAVQGSSTWQSELFWPVLLLGSELLCKDVIATRNIWEQLVRRSSEAPSLEVYARAARAAYLSMRGESADAIAAYETVLPELAPRTRVAWSTLRAHFAETLTAAGQPERAKALMLETLAAAKPEELELVGRFLEPKRQLALAEAGLGNHVEAVRQLDLLLANHGHEDQPLLIGLLHKARAEVALQMRDRPCFDAHAAKVHDHFRETKNSALIAQWKTLLEAAERAGWKRTDAASALGPSPAHSADAFTSLLTTSDPHDFALRLLLESAHASHGFLYTYNGGHLQLCAAKSETEPPHALEQTLLEQARHFELETNFDPSVDDPDDEHTQFIQSKAPPAEGAFHTELLSVRHQGKLAVVGAVIMRPAPGESLQIDHGYLNRVATALRTRAAG
ncbi:MAG TPA: protein kinase [Polyangiales bacterium]|nr:protein kinase [Polyangiales bacterium]